MNSFIGWVAPNGAVVIEQGAIDPYDMTRVCTFNKPPDSDCGNQRRFWYGAKGKFLGGGGPDIKPPGERIVAEGRYTLGLARTPVQILTTAALGEFPVIFITNGPLLRADAFGRTSDGQQLRKTK